MPVLAPKLAPRLAAALAAHVAGKLPIRIEIPGLKPASDNALTEPTAPLNPAYAAAAIHESAQRSRLMREILDMTPESNPSFLSQFSIQDLSEYARHLSTAHHQRGPQTRWIRPGNSPCITVRTARS